jgi:hypothetical protein
MRLPKRWKSWSPAAADSSATERWVLWGRGEEAPRIEGGRDAIRTSITAREIAGVRAFRNR